MSLRYHGVVSRGGACDVPFCDKPGSSAVGWSLASCERTYLGSCAAAAGRLRRTQIARLPAHDVQPPSSQRKRFQANAGARWSTRHQATPRFVEHAGARPAGQPGRGARLENQPDDRQVDRSQEDPSSADLRNRARRMRWASLLQRVFDVEALRCSPCGSTMRLISAIEDPAVARKILECLKLPARAPPLEPAAADTPDRGAGRGRLALRSVTRPSGAVARAPESVALAARAPLLLNPIPVPRAHTRPASAPYRVAAPSRPPDWRSGCCAATGAA